MSMTFAEKLAAEDARRKADLAKRHAEAAKLRKTLEETGELPPSAPDEDGDE